MNNKMSVWTILRVGLACVFLTNSIMAFTDPGEFTDLLTNSFVAGLLPVSVASFVTFIGFNDGIVALLLLLGWRTSVVATYATAWIAGVMVILGFSLDTLEHVGFLATAFVLAARNKMRA